MSAQPGADELRIRSILKTRGVGPDATPPPPVPPKPAGRPRDWLDDILDSDPPPEPEPQPEGEEPPAGEAPTPDPDPAPRKHRPAPHRHPPQSLLDAYAGVSPRLRWLAYHATAAGAGWWLGWVGWSTHTTAWLVAGRWTTPSAFVLYGLAACTIGLYRRARQWAWPAAWAAAIPVSSIVLGVLLYAPNQ